MNYLIGSPKSLEALLRVSRAGDVASDPDLVSLLRVVPSPAIRDVAICSLVTLVGQHISPELLTNAWRNAYRESLRAGVRIWVVASPLTLIDTLEQLGFRRTEMSVPGAAGASRQRVMMLDLFDIEHLWAMRSPFLEMAREFAHEPCSADPVIHAEEANPFTRLAFARNPFNRGLPNVRTAATQIRGIRRLRHRQGLVSATNQSAG
ncbi:hypothetical protein [Variibacter gotjawalensis]|nr:hypothetical protein [Variibacter gotjawalensis]NIK46898.1 hypothetical protein [Variibacter gotjawalensis]